MGKTSILDKQRSQRDLELKHLPRSQPAASDKQTSFLNLPALRDGQRRKIECLSINEHHPAEPHLALLAVEHQLSQRMLRIVTTVQVGEVAAEEEEACGGDLPVAMVVHHETNMEIPCHPRMRSAQLHPRAFEEIDPSQRE